eukprot:7261637-Prymnesium_polylepis.1
MAQESGKAKIDPFIAGAAAAAQAAQAASPLQSLTKVLGSPEGSTLRRIARDLDSTHLLLSLAAPEARPVRRMAVSRLQGASAACDPTRRASGSVATRSCATPTCVCQRQPECRRLGAQPSCQRQPCHLRRAMPTIMPAAAACHLRLVLPTARGDLTAKACRRVTLALPPCGRQTRSRCLCRPSRSSRPNGCHGCRCAAARRRRAPPYDASTLWTRTAAPSSPPLA